MLKVLIALLLLGVASVGYSQDNPPPNQESGAPQPTSPQQQQPTADNQQSNAGPAPVTEKVGDDQPDRSTQKSSEKDWAKIFIDHLPDWFVALFTGVLCIFTALLWWSTDRLWKAAVDQGRDMKASVAAATAAVEVANRAYAAEHRTWLKVYPTEIGPIIIADGKVRVTIMIEAENVGNNPAVAVSLGCEMYQIKMFAIDQMETGRVVEQTKGFASVMRGVDLLPGEKYSIRFTADAEFVPRLEEKRAATGIVRDDIPIHLNAVYCVVYKSLASADWRHSSHILWIKPDDQAGFDMSPKEIPVGSLKGTMIAGESRYG